MNQCLSVRILQSQNTVAKFLWHSSTKKKITQRQIFVAFLIRFFLSSNVPTRLNSSAPWTWFRRYVFYLRNYLSRWPVEEGRSEIFQMWSVCLTGVRFVTTSALWDPLGTVSEENCQRAWIDCNALMDLYDIYEPDVRRHPSCALWWMQHHARGPLVWWQQHFKSLFFFCEWL